MPLVHIRLPEEVIDAISNTIEGDNTTDKVRNYICSNIIGREMLLFEKSKCEAKIEYINNVLKSNPFYSEKFLSGEETDFFQETLDLLKGNPKFKENPLFITSRKNLYNEKFGKFITSKEFELMIYKFKESKEK